MRAMYLMSLVVWWFDFFLEDNKLGRDYTAWLMEAYSRRLCLS